MFFQGCCWPSLQKTPSPYFPNPRRLIFGAYQESDMLPDTALVRRSFERSSDGQSGAGVK